jgi:SRP-independent targeting protein 2/TMEM208
VKDLLWTNVIVMVLSMFWNGFFTLYLWLVVVYGWKFWTMLSAARGGMNPAAAAGNDEAFDLDSLPPDVRKKYEKRQKKEARKASRMKYGRA